MAVTTDIEQMARREEAWRRYAEMLAEDRHDNLKATSHGLARTFRGVELAGKKVLDIGSGRGLMTLFAALNDAENVVSMEPELDGSSSRVLQIQERRIEQLGLANVTPLAEDFNIWDPQGERFDVILSFLSINHLHEVPYHALRHQETYRRFVEIASKLRGLLEPGGVAIITDAARYRLKWTTRRLSRLLPKRWQSTRGTDWRIHQNPRVWKKLFLAGGFSRVEIIYPLPYRLRALHRIVETPLANYLLVGSFTLHCHY